MKTTVCMIPLNTLAYPQGGGHLWVYLNWALSLRALDCRVIWLEDIGELLATRPRAEVERDITTLDARLEAYGLGGALAIANFTDQELDARLIGGRPDLDVAAAEADLLLDFAYDIPARALAMFRRTALVDLDPGLLQLWMSRNELRVSAHDLYLTIGETVGTSKARFPDGGVRWNHTPSPVFLSAWPATEAAPGPYTTVTNWWGEWLEFDGEVVCNDKRTAFLAYVELPARSNQALEMAVTLDDYTAETDVPMLERGGWNVRDAWEACPTPEDYHDYIQGSRAEFSCAKPSCALLANAWISDRTLCYLASGKPAIVEHTGPSRFLPEGEGLLRFRDMDEAAAAIDAVEADYERHSRLARQLAEEHFDGERVVRRVLELALA
jgi:Glycosyl transferases group 1